MTEQNKSKGKLLKEFLFPCLLACFSLKKPNVTKKSIFWPGSFKNLNHIDPVAFKTFCQACICKNCCKFISDHLNRKNWINFIAKDVNLKGACKV